MTVDLKSYFMNKTEGKLQSGSQTLPTCTAESMLAELMTFLDFSFAILHQHTHKRTYTHTQFCFRHFRGLNAALSHNYCLFKLSLHLNYCKQEWLSCGIFTFSSSEGRRVTTRCVIRADACNTCEQSNHSKLTDDCTATFYLFLHVQTWTRSCVLVSKNSLSHPSSLSPSILSCPES